MAGITGMESRMSFNFPTFNQMLREDRLQDAAAYALRHEMQFDEHVQGNLAQAREGIALRAARKSGVGVALSSGEQARRRAAVLAAQTK